MIVGNAGNTALGRLVLDTLDSDEYLSYSLEPSKPWPIPKIGSLRRLLFGRIRMRKVDVVLYVGPENLTTRILLKWAKKCGKKTIVLWVGTDVWNRLNGKVPVPRHDLVDLNLACSKQLIDELATLDVKAKLLYVPTDLPEQTVPMPSEHAVLLNVPDNRAEFYGYPYLIRLIQDFPDTKFIVTRTETPEWYDFPNVDFRGMLSREDMDTAMGDCSVVIRYPVHDGMALSIIEAMAKGREVICNQPVPFTHFADSYESMREALLSIIERPPKLNVAAHEYALEEFSREKCRRAMESYLKDLQ